MKHFFYILLYLNIYIGFFQYSYGQNLILEIKAEKPVNNALLDSLNFQSDFEDYLSLKRETDTLQKKLERVGYIESELKDLYKKNDTTYIAQYFFGNRYLYIKVYYDKNDFNKNELQRVSNEITDSYFILYFPNIESALLKLTALKTEAGNPFAKIRLNNVSISSSNSISAQLEFESGFKRTIDSIAIKGYEKFPLSYLKYYAGVKKGRLFNQKKLVEQNGALNNLGFVNTIKPPEALFRKNKTTVYFYLKKQKDNLFDGILGFATNEENNNLEVNGYLNLELNNNLNFGEQLIINYKADGNEQQNFRVRTNLPYLLKSPFGVGAELQIFKRDTSFVTTDQQIQLTYQINPSSTTYIGYKGYESSNLLDMAIAGSSIEDYKSRYVITGLTYSRQQKSSLFPIKTYLSIDTEIGNRDLGDTKEAQQRISSRNNHIFNLNFKNSIFVQNLTSLILSDTYLTNELFRFGGINSIRGFDENSIDASLFSVLNTEYRYAFSESIYIHSIIDLGYFENQTFSQKEKIYSFGLGLGLQTKAGIFRFNIANGNSDNQTFGFSNTKIHLSLNSRF